MTTSDLPALKKSERTELLAESKVKCNDDAIGDVCTPLVSRLNKNQEHDYESNRYYSHLKEKPLKATQDELKCNGSARESDKEDVRTPVQYKTIAESFLDLDVTVWDGIFAILVYLSFGVVAYSFVFEKWSIVDSLYFSVVTFSSVGYGDITPGTVSGKWFTCLFAMVGVAMLGIALGVIGSHIVELDLMRITEIMESQRKHLLDNLGKRLRLSKGEEKPQQKHYSQKGVGKLLLYACVLCFQAYMIGKQQAWPISDTVYFCVISMLTVGYGDLSPHTTTEKFYAIFFIIIGVAFATEVISVIANTVKDAKLNRGLKHLQSHEMTLKDLQEMDLNHDGTVTREEFLQFMLLSLGKVEQDLLDKIHNTFDAFDHMGNGVLSNEDLVKHIRR